MSPELQDRTDQGESLYNELLLRLWTCWYEATNTTKETADVESLSSPGLALVDPEKTASESHDNPKESLQNEAIVELGQSHHSTADGAKLGSPLSAEGASLDQGNLQGEEELALERQHHEIASLSTASTIALSVCFPQFWSVYMIGVPLIDNV